MDLVKLQRELQALDILEKRVRAVVNPNPVLLREIEKRRAELMNPKETDAVKK